MTEIERLLSDTLATMEKELRKAQECQRKIAKDCQRILVVQANVSDHLQGQISYLAAQQQEFALQLQDLSNIHKKLEPIMARLNVLLLAE